MVYFYTPVPFIALFLVIVVVAAACFFKFPSLRVIRKKRNWVAYLIVPLLLGLVVYEAYDTSLGTPTIVSTVDLGNQHFPAGQVGTFSVTCENFCSRELTYNMTVTGINASLSTGNQQEYIQINNTTVGIPFHFNANNLHEKATKTVFFTPNSNGDDIQVWLDYPLISTGSNIHIIQGTWNAATNTYTMEAVYGPSLA
jgi:hypothetical protein